MRPQCELHSKRLRLRPLVLADAPDIFAYASDPCVIKFVGWETHRSVSDSVAFIERTQSVYWQGITFGVELAEQRRIIGTFELRITSRAEGVGNIGYVLARPFWGQGYNVEAGIALLCYAFRIELLRRIEARCAVQNRRSFRTLEKLGMRRERFVVFSTGEETGHAAFLCYSLTRSEWARHPMHSSWRHQIRIHHLSRS
ncbi:MAG: GNAT family N-acetyltransferase [candidate division KSB1 bacterium]|nr:GNAT family N-acetyltransferase [candidate division KSB1 bacterium]